MWKNYNLDKHDNKILNIFSFISLLGNSEHKSLKNELFKFEINWETVYITPYTEIFFELNEKWKEIVQNQGIKIIKDDKGKIFTKLDIEKFLEVFSRQFPLFNTCISNEIIIPSKSKSDFYSKFWKVWWEVKDWVDEALNKEIQGIEINLNEDVRFRELTKYWKYLFTNTYKIDDFWNINIKLWKLLNLFLEENSSNPKKIFRKKSFDVQAWWNMVTINLSNEFLVKLRPEWELFLLKKGIEKSKNKNWYTRFTFSQFIELFWSKLSNSQLLGMLDPNILIVSKKTKYNS